MHYLNKYFKSILVYDLLNKFNYTNIKKFPEITKVILILNTKEYNLKALISSLFCLELVSKKKSALVFSKQNNIKINIKKGNPIGCKVTLRNNSMHLFIAKLTRLHKINLSRPLKKL